MLPLYNHGWKISPSTRFHLQQIIFEFLIQIGPKRIFSIRKKKIDYHHRIQHIQISLITLKQTIYYSGTNWPRNGTFGTNRKMEQHHQIQYQILA